MIRFLITGALVLAMIAGCGGNDDAVPADTSSESPSLSEETTSMSTLALKEKLFGTWQVAYEDEVLGQVLGTAFIDPVVETAEVRLTPPGGGSSVQLTAKSIVVDKAQLVITLPSGSPKGHARFDPAGDIQNVGQSARLSLGDGALDLELGEPEPVNGDVVITLRYDEANDTLAGQWVQAVDARTGTAQGGGRRGFFRYGDADSGGGEMVGREIWQRPAPVVRATFAIGDQFETSRTGPTWPYPFVVGTSEPAERGVDERYLMILGDNLPRNIREDIRIESQNELLHYRVHRTMDSYADLPAADTFLRDTGFAYIDRVEALGHTPLDRSPNDDFMILHVRLKPGIEPGVQTLRINGVETEWLLRFGDHRADIGLARDLAREVRNRPGVSGPIPVQTAHTDFVFENEQIYFDVRADSELPMKSIGFFLAKNGQPLLFDGIRELQARPIADSPTTLRSDPIYVVSPGTRGQYPNDALVIEVSSDDRLQAALTQNVLATNTASVDVGVLESPVELRRAITAQPDAGDGLLWTDAVFRSSECALSNLVSDAAWEAAVNAIDTAWSLDKGKLISDAMKRREQILALLKIIESGDSRQLSRKDAEVFVDYAPLNWVFEAIGDPIEARLETPISIGEHAGMLIIRQVLIDLLKSNLPLYASARDDDEILGIRARLRPHIVYDPELGIVDLGNIGINTVPIAAPDGHRWKLEMSYLESYLEAEFKLTGEALVRYQISAMREARQSFADALRTTIARAEEIDDCDVYELSKLTGFGMERVAERAKVAVMTQVPLENGVDEWVTDWTAQVYLEKVAHVSETLAIQEGVSKEGWDDLFTAVSIVSLPLGHVATGTRAAYAILVVTRAAAGTDILVSAWNKWDQQQRESLELDYALGASAIIGTSRYNAALANDTSAWSFVLSAAATAYPGVSTYETWTKAGELATRTAAARGMGLVEASLAKATSSMAIQFAQSALTMSQQHDVAAAVHYAMGLEATIGRAAMVEDELRVLELVDQLAHHGENPPQPEWATSLDPATLATLGDKIYRNDIRQLLPQSAANIAAAAGDEDGIRVLHRPLIDSEQLTRSIESIKALPPARGARFVEQAAEPEYWDVERKINDAGFHFDSKEYDDGVILTAYEGRGDQHRLFQIERSRVSDRVLGTGKELVRFEKSVWQPDLSSSGGGNPNRHVDPVNVPYLDDVPGVPMRLFTELRAMQLLGFDYRDARLGGFVLSNVRDARLLGEMHWMRAQEPGRSPEDAFRNTTAMDSMGALARQLGFRIGTVRVVDQFAVDTDPWNGEWQPSAPLQHLATRQWLAVPDSKDWATARQAFLRAHEVPAAETTRADSRVPYGYTIYLELMPAR